MWVDEMEAMDLEAPEISEVEAMELEVMDVIEIGVVETLADVALDEYQREEFEAAKKRGYLMLDRLADPGKLWTVYEYWCAFMYIPELIVSKGLVQMRLLEGYRNFIHRELTSHGENEMHELLEKYDTKKTQAGGNVVFALGVPQEECEPLAQEMLQTILEPGIVHPWFFGCKFSPPKAWLAKFSQGWSSHG